ncbi:outer membrane protein assembly factor BamB family protein [Streptomyces sp. NPDC002643]
MTQPPGQPPYGGGFGTPQDPSRQQSHQQPQAQPQPGPYGYPHTPPPQGPPVQNHPGYGYPQSGPYAAQPGPYTPPPQPGYGYPQSQYPGAPTPPPAQGGGGGSRNPFKGRPAMAIGAAVAALAVIGGAVFAVTSLGGDDEGDKKPVAQESPKASEDAKPSTEPSAPVNPGDGSGDGGEDLDVTDLNAGRKDGEAKVLWYKSAPDAPGSGADAPGLWVTDKVAVKAAYKQVFAFGVADGNPAWDPIEFDGKICAVTRQATAGKIVVAHQKTNASNAKCNQLQQIDLDTGEKGWTAEVDEGALFDSTLSLGLTVTGNTLMVGRSQSGTAYDVTTGKKLWDKKDYGQSCYPDGFAGGKKLIAVSSCAAGSDKKHDEVQELDPKTGKAKWTRKIPTGWRVEYAYSTDPVVLYLTNEDENKWNISTFNGDGSTRSQVDIKDSIAPDCDGGFLDRGLEGCSGVVVASNTLYLPTEAKDSTNAIVAINLANGKEKWRVKSAEGSSMAPMKTDGTKLIAYVEPGYSVGGEIVSVPTTGKNHKATRLLQMPSSAAKIESAFFSQAYDYVGGRFFLSTTTLTGSDEAKEKLMLAYGK